jgi:hypothetical protein
LALREKGTVLFRSRSCAVIGNTVVLTDRGSIPLSSTR